MEDFYERVLIEKAKRKLSNKELGKLVDKTEAAFRMALKRRSLSKLEIDRLEQYFGIEQNTDNITVKEPLNFYKTKNGHQYEELPNGKFLIHSKLIPVKAQASYISQYQDADFVDSMQEVIWIVDRVGNGKYRTFEVMNDSMNDGSINSLPNGSYVLGRELQKHHWKDKLRTSQYPYWIINHRDGMVIKEIINHDTERGIITCHSLNESPEYNDFEIQLNDVREMYNIIKKQIDI